MVGCVHGGAQENAEEKKNFFFFFLSGMKVLGFGGSELWNVCCH